MAQDPQGAEDRPARAGEDPAAVAALIHVTGPSRGRMSWLSGSALDVRLGPDRRLGAAPATGPEPPAGAVARLVQIGSTYLLEAVPGHPVWVNGAAVTERRLDHNDMIEFSPRGPLSRFQLCDDSHPMRRNVADILADSVAYLKVSRRPPLARLWHALLGTALRLLRETTVLFRATVLIALVAVAAVAWHQARTIARLEAQVTHGAARLDSIAAALARAREEALRPGDLVAIRADLGAALTSAQARLERLEERWQAGAQVIAGAAPAIAFLQGAYGFRDRETGRMLRHVVGGDGAPLLMPNGQPFLGLEGDGPVAEREFTGTGFLVGAPPVLATNRHVALPWERDAASEAAATLGLDPLPLRLVAWLPGRTEPVAVSLRRAGEAADLALLDIAEGVAGLPVLPLGETPPHQGEEVIVLGYPTGLRSMLAQSGEGFVRGLIEAGETDFWEIAAGLARAGYIRPLASRGIVGQVTPAAVVFDAETTHGGSGGPVLDMGGRVVAVQSAILPEYGGSNLGVPVAALRDLLAAPATD